MSKLRIMMIAPTPFFADRGSHVRILEEANALKNSGNEILIVTYGLGRDVKGMNIKRTFRFPWYKKVSAGPSWHKIYVDIFLFFTALRKAISFKPDIIHGHLHEGCLISWLVGKLTRKPFVFDYQGSLTAEMGNHKFIKPKSMIYRLFYRIEQFINRLPKNIITSSSMGKDELVKNFDISLERVIVIQDGVGEVNIADDKLDIRRKYNIPVKSKIAVYVGVLTDYQGTDLMLESIAENNDKLRDICFLLFGYPEELYKDKAQKLGLENVIFPGMLKYEEIYNYLAQADFAVAPKISKTEANGKVYNYMAVKLPVVLFDSAINREIIGEKGVFARHGDKNDFALKVIDLAKSGHTKIDYDLKDDIFWSSRIGVLEDIYRKNLAKG